MRDPLWDGVVAKLREEGGDSPAGTHDRLFDPTLSMDDFGSKEEADEWWANTAMARMALLLGLALQLEENAMA